MSTTDTEPTAAHGPGVQADIKARLERNARAAMLNTMLYGGAFFDKATGDVIPHDQVAVKHPDPALPANTIYVAPAGTRPSTRLTGADLSDFKPLGILTDPVDFTQRDDDTGRRTLFPDSSSWSMTIPVAEVDAASIALLFGRPLPEPTRWERIKCFWRTLHNWRDLADTSDGFHQQQCGRCHARRYVD